jgi:hypothetical protein
MTEKAILFLGSDSGLANHPKSGGMRIPQRPTPIATIPDSSSDRGSDERRKSIDGVA